MSPGLRALDSILSCLDPFQFPAVVRHRRLPHSHPSTPRAQLLTQIQLTLTHGSALSSDPFIPVSGPVSSTVLLEALPALPQSIPIYTFALQVLTEH